MFLTSTCYTLDSAWPVENVKSVIKWLNKNSENSELPSSSYSNVFERVRFSFPREKKKRKKEETDVNIPDNFYK